MTIPRRTPDNPDQRDVWTELAAPLPLSVVQWRQQGNPKRRDGKWFAPFVAYIDAQFVRDRLDAIVPGEWDLTLELLPTIASDEHDDSNCSFKARLQILGVIREDVGTGRDYKSAATDAFKRAAVRYGIGHELYTDYEILWVQVDGDGKYAKPLEDPATVYARKLNRVAPVESRTSAPPFRREAPITPQKPTAPTDDDDLVDDVDTNDDAPQPHQSSGPLAADEPSCPKCGGRMWDNRLSKKNPKAPDYKCRSRSCDGVIWPARPAKPSSGFPDEVPF